MSRLYVWDSEVLADWANGQITVCAETVEEARSKAENAFNDVLPMIDRSGYAASWCDSVPSPDITDWDELEITYNAYMRDLLGEPTVKDNGVSFVRGSA